MAFLNGIWTIIAVGFSTIATLVFCYKTSNYLIQNHNNTTAKNQLKFLLKQRFKSLDKVKNQYLILKQRFTDGSVASDDAVSCVSSTLSALKPRDLLEFDECLSRLLEQLDSLQISKQDAAVDCIELTKVVELFGLKKKKLIKEIQESCTELDGFISIAVPPKSGLGLAA